MKHPPSFSACAVGFYVPSWLRYSLPIVQSHTNVGRCDSPAVISWFTVKEIILDDLEGLNPISWKTLKEELRIPGEEVILPTDNSINFSLRVPTCTSSQPACLPHALRSCLGSSCNCISPFLAINFLLYTYATNFVSLVDPGWHIQWSSQWSTVTTFERVTGSNHSQVVQNRIQRPE